MLQVAAYRQEVSDKAPSPSAARRHRVIGELQIPIVAAGRAAFVAIDDFEQIPIQAWLVRPEALNQRRDIEDCRRRHVRQSTDNPKPEASLPPSVGSERYSLPKANSTEIAPSEPGIYSC
jgi:hypothetical protein